MPKLKLAFSKWFQSAKDDEGDNDDRNGDDDDKADDDGNDEW